MRIYKKLLMPLLLAVFIAGCDGCADNRQNVGEASPGEGVGGASPDEGASPDASGFAAPTVSSTIPSGDETDVFLNRKISAAFSGEMDPETLTGTTFTLMQGDVPVSGTVTSSGNTAIFTPASDLTASADYTATITTGAEDFAGNALASDYIWTFTTGATADTIAPAASSTNPLDGGIDVFLNSNLSATFSEAIDPETCTTSTFTLMQGTTLVEGTVTCVDRTATFNPISDLAANAEYTATITTGIKDLAGNSLPADQVWTFTTGATADTTAPIVGSTDPLDRATGVAINGNVTATFSEAIDPLTITGVTFTLDQGVTPVAGAATSAGSVATFNPTSDLAADTDYTVTITTGAKDLAGNALAGDYVWSFTTGTTAALGPAAVNLGTSGAFAILTKSGVTDVPTSAITGNVGASPITGAAILVTCTEVTGTIFSVDAAGPACKVTDPTLLTAAVGDMEIAYTDAAGRPIPDFTELGAGEIGGLTIVPGLYKWSSNVLITTDVTLSGGANDVWIFQIAGDITQANGTRVNLAGGAQAKNIFWQVGGGTGVALGTTAHFEGTILAIKAINLTTGATVNGRLLAQTAVTLQQNAVTRPSP